MTASCLGAPYGISSQVRQGSGHEPNEAMIIGIASVMYAGLENFFHRPPWARCGRGAQRFESAQSWVGDVETFFQVAAIRALQQGGPLRAAAKTTTAPAPLWLSHFASHPERLRHSNRAETPLTASRRTLVLDLVEGGR